MRISIENIRNLLKAIGFQPEDGVNNIFVKKYTQQNYVIRVNFNTSKIEYRENDVKPENGIQWGDLTTSNFENSENFVVLECVNRLLEKGYAPKNLYLEYKFPLGRNEKGKLDILVFDNDRKAYLMIECKTWGAEFSKEEKKMLKDGGQLFSYYVQDKATKYLCLYTSRCDKGNVEYKNNIIKVDDAWAELTNQKEIHDHWNKNSKDNGVFEEWANAYNVEIKALVRSRLLPLTKDDSGRIFNQFAEILRHNVVSDKPNAFNKILNLFICKIIDEDKNDNEQVEFQWLEDDTDESLQIRLNDLYKQGMHRFLDIDVTDFSESDISNTLANIGDLNAQKVIMDMFVKLRLQKNPEFAFIEVYDDASFKLNARVVREVVELLQPYQFRYGHKQQFLGDFFELLLNTSIKQEAGQYFTPVPITRYIVSSIPIKEMIERKLSANEAEMLPTVIDFACGTGHFLTEYMDRVQSIIENEIDIKKAKPIARKKLQGWIDYDKFGWACDYVYGIDADYRLVKSSKVSSFLNGDGEANIIRANGLDHFEKSKEYKGKLKATSRADRKDNSQFDILIANPPYSVSSFKSTVKNGEQSFELFSRLTDNSSEIECLFIERMKQLLKIGGYAGIILPISVLSSTGIYTAAREILLKYFKIVAITEFGSNTFMATNTNTITLFLERRENADHKNIFTAVRTFFDKPKDVTVLGIEKAFSKYAVNVFNGVSFEDYVSLVNKKPNKKIKEHEIFKDYCRWFEKLSDVIKLKASKDFGEKSKVEQDTLLAELFFSKVLAVEQEKVCYFLLAYGQTTVVTKVGEKQAEKEFLGYEFSNRRGHEGIKMLPEGTRLYNADESISPEYANFYTYNSFLSNYKEIDELMGENVWYNYLWNLMDFGRPIFEKTINLNLSKKQDISSWKYPAERLSYCLQPISGASEKIAAKEVQPVGEYPVISQNRDTLIDGYCNDIAPTTDLPVILFGDHNCHFKYLDFPFVQGGDGTQLIKCSSEYEPKFLYYVLWSQREYIANLNKYERHYKYLKDLYIPRPPIPVQKEVVKRVDEWESVVEANQGEISKKAKGIDDIISSVEGDNVSLGTILLQITDRVSGDNIESSHYVNTDTMLQKCRGIIEFTGRVPAGSVMNFKSNDILLSNIRPYLRKLWLANFDGGCSPDVLIFRLRDDAKYDVRYIFAMLRQQDFFDYVMENVKGVKMPRGKEEHIKNYKLCIPRDINTQSSIANEIAAIEREISELEEGIIEAKKMQMEILASYLW